MAAVEAAGGSVTEAPYSSLAADGSCSPTTAATSWRCGHPPESVVSRAARPRGSRRPPAHAGPAAPGPRSAWPGGARPRRGDRAAVVVERELDDAGGLEGTGGEVDTARRASPAGRRAAGARRRSISSSATSGRHRATSRAASASAVCTRPGAAAIGLADVGELAAAGRRTPPRTPPHPRARGTSPCLPATTASPASRAAALSSAGPPSPAGSPSAGQARPRRPTTGRAQAAERRGERPRRPLRRQPDHPVGRVVADDRVDREVGDDLAAQPRGAPPGQAGRGGKGRAHGRRGYAGRAVVPSLRWRHGRRPRVRRRHGAAGDGHPARRDHLAGRRARALGGAGPQRCREDHAAAGRGGG